MNSVLRSWGRELHTCKILRLLASAIVHVACCFFIMLESDMFVMIALKIAGSWCLRRTLQTNGKFDHEIRHGHEDAQIDRAGLTIFY